MASEPDIRLLTSPRIFLVGMMSFLVLVGFVVLVLYKSIAIAFSANPGLNGLIIGVLAIGSLFAFRQVFRLFREIHWVNSLVTTADAGRVGRPRLLAPMATMLERGRRRARPVHGDDAGDPRFGRHAARRGARTQPLSRRSAGLPRPARHFLGPARDRAFDQRRHRSMKTGADTTTMFDDLKSGLSAPIAGMSVSFTSSLFGLAGSLILGFLDLQAGQAQNRFYTELEDFLAEPCRDRAAAGSRRRGFAPLGRGNDRRISARARRLWPISPRAFRRWSRICASEQQHDPRLGRGAGRATGRHQASCCAVSSAERGTQI